METGAGVAVCFGPIPDFARAQPGLQVPRSKAALAVGPSKETSMPVYKAPVEDVLFLLNDVFHTERLANLPGFADAAPDVVEAMLGEVGKFCEGVLAPL